MGKSTAAARFAAKGIAVFDADAKVHDLYNGPFAAKIEAAFPGTTATGRVDRSKLSNVLVKEPEKFKLLEAIVHPAVRDAERAFVEQHAKAGAQMVVLEIPLLFESGGSENVDVVIVVSASAEIQRARVLARPGVTAAKLEGLLARQLPDAEKRAKADFVVDTSGTVQSCNMQVDAIIGELSHKSGDAFKRFWA